MRDSRAIVAIVWAMQVVGGDKRMIDSCTTASKSMHIL